MRIRVVTEPEEGVLDLSDLSAYPEIAKPEGFDLNDTDAVEKYLGNHEIEILELANEIETITDDELLSVYFSRLLEGTIYARVLASKIEAGINGEDYSRSDTSSSSESESEPEISPQPVAASSIARTQESPSPPVVRSVPSRAKQPTVPLAAQIKTNFVPPEELVEFEKRKPTKVRLGLRMETFEVRGKEVTTFSLA